MLAIHVSRTDFASTNLSEAMVIIGVSRDANIVAQCTSAVSPEEPGPQKTISGAAFSTFSALSAGAGNRFESTSYRTLHNGVCYAITKLIHYGVLENYDPDAVHAYDARALNAKLDPIVQSFQFIR